MQPSSSLVLILTEVTGLSSTGIALVIAVMQLFCTTVAHEAIRSVCVEVNRQCHIIVNECPLTKYPGRLQALHTADEDAIKRLRKFSNQHMLNKNNK